MARSYNKSACLAFIAAALAGCGTHRGAPKAAAPAAAPDWHDIATASDRGRLRNWRSAFVAGLRKAAASGYGADVAGEGALLAPDAAIAWKDPPAGAYRCRTIKLGAKSTGMLDYAAYPGFTCRIRAEDGMMSFAKLTGSQRPIGLLLPDAGRMVFLGTLQLGDEGRALEYGRDRERDMAGLIERIGEDRWRLILPYPHFESTVDVIELVPAAS